MLVLYDSNSNYTHTKVIHARTWYHISPGISTSPQNLAIPWHTPQATKTGQWSIPGSHILHGWGKPHISAIFSSYKSEEHSWTINPYIENHFITCLYETDPIFNLKLWDKLLPQALLSPQHYPGKPPQPTSLRILISLWYVRFQSSATCSTRYQDIHTRKIRPTSNLVSTYTVVYQFTCLRIFTTHHPPHVEWVDMLINVWMMIYQEWCIQIMNDNIGNK